jgi:TRAP-type C4-dicarboxylate transport system permease small subunit
MSLFHLIDAFLGRLYSCIGTLVGLSIAGFALAISTDLLLRNLGLGNLPGVHEIIEYVLFSGVFLAAPWVLRMNAHVRVDLVLGSLPEGAAKVADLALDFLGLIICVTLIWFGSRNLGDAYAFGSMQMKYFTVPEWWLLLVFVISFSMLAFEFFSRMIRGSDTPETDEAADDLGAV